MTDLDRYLRAAERPNTQRSYASAIRDFEETWGGFLPASVDAISRYLAERASTYSASTLKHRLAALSHWHQTHGFSDPTKSPRIHQLLKGIRTVHPADEKRAKPLALEVLQRVSDWLERAIEAASGQGKHGDALRHRRDRAWLLLGFWRGFRAAELANLEIRFIEITEGEGLICYLPHSKGDRSAAGRRFACPALSRLCPVKAVSEWLQAANLSDGYLFRKIDRWGHLHQEPLAPGSIIPMMRRLLTHAGVADAEDFSSHSLRRGFAQWTRDSGWDMRMLMSYVGWRDIKSAMRYLDGAEADLKAQFEQGLTPAPAAHQPLATLPAVVPPAATTIHVVFTLSAYSGKVRDQERAQRDIEQTCLARYAASPLTGAAPGFCLQLPTVQHDLIEETVYALLDECHQIADAHECYLDIRCHDPATGEHWD